MKKFYSEEIKYSRKLYNVLDSKFLVFKKICKNVEVLFGSFLKFFFIILKSEALDFYYSIFY